MKKIVISAISILSILGASLLIFIMPVLAITGERYDTLNGKKVIWNDGKSAYTEDGEKWSFDGHWYAQDETRTVADLVPCENLEDPMETSNTATTETSIQHSENLPEKKENTTSNTSISTTSETTSKSRENSLNTMEGTTQYINKDSDYSTTAETMRSTEKVQDSQPIKASLDKSSTNPENVNDLSRKESQEDPVPVASTTERVSVSADISSSKKEKADDVPQLPRTSEHNPKSALIKCLGIFMLSGGMALLVRNKKKQS